MLTRDLIRFFILFLLLVVSGCKKSISWEESRSKFLSSDPKSKEFREGLQGVANHLYANQWPEKYHFTKPKIRHEKMLVEWEHKVKQKTIRKDTNGRCSSNIERLGLSFIISELGPTNLDRLLNSLEFKQFIENLKIFLGEDENKEESFNAAISSKNLILEKFKVSEKMAKENEANYKSGIIITTGFYLGFPLYKRITLDSQIQNREEYLQVYLHECGHQLFDNDRKFWKTLKLGFSWIGWLKSTDSWWVVEEKSCNLFAELILENNKLELQSDKRYQEKLATSNWVYFPLSKDYKEKYARLFYNSEAMLAQLKNTRINNRYSTNDAIAKVFKEKIQEIGAPKFIHQINKFITLKEVLIILNAKDLVNKE